MEAALVSRLERAVERLEKLQAGAAASPTTLEPATEGSAASIVDWDKLMAEYMVQVQALVQNLPAQLISWPTQAQQSMQNFHRGFTATRRVLELAAAAKKPDSPSQLQALLAPVADAMGAVQQAAEGRQSRECPHHLKMLSEAVAALGFLAYTGHGCGMSSPRQHVADSWQSAEFFANKLLMEFRGKDEAQVSWVKGIKTLMQQLEKYVVRHCPTGLAFNPNGVSLDAAMKAGSTAAAPQQPPAPSAAPAPSPAPAAPRGPPPPPPGPPPKPLTLEELGTAGPREDGGDSASMSALFKELSKGEGITTGLRKVTADMKTKNQSERSGVVPATAATATPPASAGGAMSTSRGPRAAGQPKLELKGTKWQVEHHVGRQDLVVENTEPKNSVYVYGCTDCVLQVKGKVNAITLDGCRRVGLVFDNVISSAEAVNCYSVQMQATGTVPTISVEKTDGAQLYLSKQCAADPNFQIVSAKCSSINVVVVPGETDTEDPAEHPLPEQYISSFKNGTLITVAAEHSGA